MTRYTGPQTDAYLRNRLNEWFARENHVKVNATQICRTWVDPTGTGGEPSGPVVLSNFVDDLDQDPPVVLFDSTHAGTLYWEFHSTATDPGQGLGDIGSGSDTVVAGANEVEIDLSAYSGNTGYIHFRVVAVEGTSNVLTSQVITTPVAAPDSLFGVGDEGFTLSLSDSTKLYTDAGITNVTAPGDAVYRVESEVNSVIFDQATAASRPIWTRHPKSGVRNLADYSHAISEANWGTVLSSNMTVTGNQVEVTGGNGYGYFRQELVRAASETKTMTISVTCDTTVNDVAIRGSTRTSGEDAEFKLVDFVAGVEQIVTLNLSANTTGTIDIGVEGRTTIATGASQATGHTVTFNYIQLELGGTASTIQTRVSQYDVTEAGSNDCYGMTFDGSDDRIVSVASVDLSAVTSLASCFGLRSESASTEVMLQTATSGARVSLQRSTTSLVSFAQQAVTPIGNASSPVLASVPVSAVMTTLSDTTRTLTAADGVDGTETTGSQSGGYGNNSVSIGSQTTANFNFTGVIYDGLTLIGRALTSQEISDLETYVAARTPEVSL